MKHIGSCNYKHRGYLVSRLYRNCYEIQLFDKEKWEFKRIGTRKSLREAERLIN